MPIKPKCLNIADSEQLKTYIQVAKNQMQSFLYADADLPENAEGSCRGSRKRLLVEVVAALIIRY
jgi:hypothetical protein